MKKMTVIRDYFLLSCHGFFGVYAIIIVTIILLLSKYRYEITGGLLGFVIFLALILVIFFVLFLLSMRLLSKHLQQ